MAKELILERSSKDYYGRQNIRIVINSEEVEIPMSVIKDFIEDENKLASSITIPE